MATINQHYKSLQSGYLFSEIAKRTTQFIENNPNREIIKLGIGNTTEALPKSVIDGLIVAVNKLANNITYTGYGDEQGNERLRNALVDWYKGLEIYFDAKEIFISDGAKSDTANIASIFSEKSIIAVQDPVYPVYVDSNVISGRGGEFHNGRYEKIVYLDCMKENNLFPKVPEQHVDIIYICSPNNPTGVAATKAQLKKFIDYAIDQKAVIVFDAAYSAYITDPKLPKSIYEIPGSKKCAIEINSFSKWAGFTGVRLGWTVVPQELNVKGTKNGQINSIWNRRQTTMFNGASNIAQAGGLAVLSKKGQKECKKITDYYLENSQIISDAMERLGLMVFGGKNAPYVWIEIPKNMSSWQFFDKLLSEANVIGTPGSGFGLRGEGYFRFSAFGHRENIKKAIKSIETNLKL